MADAHERIGDASHGPPVLVKPMRRTDWVGTAANGESQHRQWKWQGRQWGMAAPAKEATAVRTH